MMNPSGTGNIFPTIGFAIQLFYANFFAEKQ